MSCTNCFSGCVETISDKCVKYTGAPVSFLDVSTGDTLYYVEEKIVAFLSSIKDATGIVPDLGDTEICEIVSKYITCEGCTELTLQALLIALIQAACDLQEQIDALDDDITTLNSSYTLDCITAVDAADTHTVLQAVIDKVCSIDSDLTDLTAALSSYVEIDDINLYIAAYLNGLPSTNKMYTKMVPYVAYEYYGSLTNFDISGKGIAGTQWESVYLCNGQNGTPDKRGVVAVGVIEMGGGALDAKVDPVISPTFNPDYAIGGGIYGANSTVLSESQIPSHTHVATAVVTDAGHSHEYSINSAGVTGDNQGPVTPGGYRDINTTSTDVTNISVDVTNASTGGGLGHSNIQPSIAAYYIMYIP